MRLAIDCRLWNEGGVGRYLRNLVQELSEIDDQNEYTLFFWKRAPPLGFKNFQTRVTTAKWHTIFEQTVFWRELERENFDLVHFPYFAYPILYRKPFVLTIHDLTIKHFPTGRATTRHPLVYALKHQAYEQVLNQGIKNARQILVPSEFVKTDVISHYPLSENRIRVTPEGVGFEFKDVLPRKPELVGQRFWLYVGNFYPHKNVEFLLRAFAKSPKTKEKLVLYGPYDFFTLRIKALVRKLNLMDRVVFQKHMGEAELIWLYSHAKALVLPSLGEGFGLPVVEAAAYNCPLVLSEIPVFREIAPSGARFFSPHNEAELIEQLTQAHPRLSVPQSYFKKFSFRGMAEQTLAVYQAAGK